MIDILIDFGVGAVVLAAFIGWILFLYCYPWIAAALAAVGICIAVGAMVTRAR